MSVGVVAKLQSELSFEGLAVGDPRLGLDATAPWTRCGPADLGIPRPTVAIDRQTNLCAPSKAWVEDCAQSFE
jgi:hypothetical protein